MPARDDGNVIAVFAASRRIYFAATMAIKLPPAGARRAALRAGGFLAVTLKWPQR